ncbi:Diadenosine tetraphosphate (Ap4A) hydrolase [Kaistia soli DSM 19436]|uniref:Diadenosine tetraphosphate (Ap4A) hydrolase n=1 Tax=Kaistia soli DSM 19436 TaxID=1122133 RepID=A0A1M4WMM5_9HYPH|nr:Diadenosine tetraphosphate (Ap4A) hydrolase [Kaistia soli DSM 19436]
MADLACAHCRGINEDRLWAGDLYRVVLVHETGFEGWGRVIWNAHVAEITDLPSPQQSMALQAVLALERALRAELTPDKINIASLATGMPHLHVHVIPRFRDDPTFPEPVWLPAQRSSARTLPAGFAERMRRRLTEELGPSDHDRPAV